MNETVSVSVVIPCYCCANTIARAVESVASQTRIPLELILVDDCSTDDTRSVLRKLSQTYAPGWIKLLFLEDNVGAASARNAGWNAARGRYVAFLDSDDSWHPCKIEIQHQLMNDNRNVAISGHDHIQANGVPLPRVLGQTEFHLVSTRYILLKNPFVTPSFMVRQDLLLRFRPGRRYMEDHLFLMQAATVGLMIAKVSLPLTFIYKNIYGDSGLSADLWAMQRSELDNYRILCNEGAISDTFALCLQAYSWLKYGRRVFIVVFRSNLPCPKRPIKK